MFTKKFFFCSLPKLKCVDHKIYDPGGQGDRNTLKELKGEAMESKTNITEEDERDHYKSLNNDP